MSYSQRNYRHRNPKADDKKSSTPFFSGEKASSIQRKGKGDLLEKDKGMIQRLATSKEDEKLGTNDARMEKDKEEPMKPVVQKCGKEDGEKKKDKS